MDVKDLPADKKRWLYNKVRKCRQRYGVEWGSAELLERIMALKAFRQGMMNPRLVSRDGSWRLESVIWKDAPKKGYYRSGRRWYVRGVPGKSFGSEEAVRAFLGL